MKISGILVTWALLAFFQNANTASIQEGTGETYKLIGISNPRVTIGDNAVVRFGSDVEIKCPVDVSPEETPQIEWEIDGVQLVFIGFNAEGYPNIRRYNEMALTIYNVSERHAATYTCVLSYISDTGPTTQRADTRIELAPECPENCQGEIGQKGYPGSRGQEGLVGRSGLPGICYPEECPKPESGEKGDKGGPGNDGQLGSEGDKGENGFVGDKGRKGVVGDRGTKGGDGDQGVNGNKGQPGSDGEGGLKGDSGDEGASGNGGEKGMKGMTGDQGPKGTGPPGDDGDTGEQGGTGDIGDNGTKGVRGSKGLQGDKGQKGGVGNQGSKGGVGDKGPVGMRIIIRDLNSTANPDCQGYEVGQIVFDSAIDRFVYCDGTNFQCVRDRPCFDECDATEEPTLTQTPEEAAKCINLIYAIDESASMGPEHEWLADVSGQIPEVLEGINFVPSKFCENYFGVLRFGADSSSGKDHIGRPLDLGGVTVDGKELPLWGSSQDATDLVNASQFLAAGRLEDGYAAIYRSLQLYTFVHPACRKIILITDEDRDNLTPTSDPEETRIPTLLNQNMAQILKQFSIVLSAIVNLNIEIDPSHSIPSNRILAVLPDDRIVYITGVSNPPFGITPATNIELKIPGSDDLTQNTKDTYNEMVRMTGGILWSLPVSREFRELFTVAFLQQEVLPNIPTTEGKPNPDSTCTVAGCQNCACIDREISCTQIKTLDFATTEQCRPTECNMTVVIDGFRQPSCVDMVFAVAETEQMDDIHANVQDVATGLVRNLAQINFGQENSLCQNQYCLMTFGEDNNRVQNTCYAQSFSPTPQQLCGTSSEVGGYIIGFNFEGSGFTSDGYAAIYTALRNYPAEFQDQSCRHITLITNGARASCGSFQTDENVNVPDLDRQDIERELERENVILNVIVNAEFEDGEGREALGIFKDIDDTIKAVVATSASDSDESPGGKVKAGTAVFNTESAYIMLALSRGGSAWNIETMGTQTDSFTQAFVKNVVRRSSQSCGRTRACVECRCVSGLLEQCEDSSLCETGEVPELRWTSGNVTITTDNVIVDVGGYGDTEERVYYGLDGDLLTRFTIGSSLIRGTQPVTVTWYYVDTNGNNIPIEQSPVASYASVSTTNPYNLIFSQVGDNIQGTYVLIAENEHGRDTQFTTIGILPKWDKTVSGTVTGTQAQLGQTLIARTGSEVRIDGIVREGTRPWSFQWLYNGVELIEGTDYSFEYSGNSASIIIHNFQSSGVGEYTAVVMNRYGEDRHTFNLFAQTLVSCDNNPESTVTTCSNCVPNGLTGQATLTLYAHSFSQNQQLSWVRIPKNGQNRETVITENIVLGANRFVVPVTDICLYDYEVVVRGQSAYAFNCPCNDCVGPDETLTCCGESERLLTESDCGENFFADICILVDVSASMDTEHAFLREFLPRFESSLRGSCVGNSSMNPNQYTFVAFGSTGDKENPYFVGPDLDRGDSTQGVFFTIDPNDDSNVTRTIDRLPTVGEREDGYAATNFVVKYGQLRPGSLRFAILVTDEYRDFFYRDLNEVIESSTLFNDFSDYGRSLYVDLFSTHSIIPIQIIDVDLSSGGTDCLGVSSAETCFYRLPGSVDIERLENTQVINTVTNQALSSIHIDYLQTAMDAGGYVWDLKVIRRNETGNWDAITDALTSEVLTRASEELTQCRDCRCLPGGRQCEIVPPADQRACKCEKAFPGNTAYCNCDIAAANTRARNYCRCRYISLLSDSFCLSIGDIQKVGP